VEGHVQRTKLYKYITAITSAEYIILQNDISNKYLPSFERWIKVETYFFVFNVKSSYDFDDFFLLFFNEHYRLLAFLQKCFK